MALVRNAAISLVAMAASVAAFAADFASDRCNEPLFFGYTYCPGEVADWHNNRDPRGLTSYYMESNAASFPVTGIKLTERSEVGSELSFQSSWADLSFACSQCCRQFGRTVPGNFFSGTEQYFYSINGVTGECRCCGFAESDFAENVVDARGLLTTKLQTAAEAYNWRTLSVSGCPNTVGTCEGCNPLSQSERALNPNAFCPADLEVSRKLQESGVPMTAKVDALVDAVESSNDWE